MKIEKLQRFIGHRSRVNCVYFGTNLIISGGEDCCSIIWNTMTGKSVRTFQQEKPVTSCCLILNDSIAISCDDYSSFIWKTESGVTLQVVQFGERICQINSSNNSELHFTTAHGDIVTYFLTEDNVFERSNHEGLQSPNNNNNSSPKISIDPYSEQVTVEFLTSKYIVLTGQTRVAFVCFNLKRQLLFTTSATSLDATLKIFCFHSNFIHDQYIAEPIACFDSHSEGINQIALNQEATYLVTASSDCTLVLIDLFPVERQILLALACSKSSSSTSRISQIWTSKIGKMLRDLLF